MKKIVLSLAVLFSVAMVSCGNKQADAVDTDTAVAVEVAEEVAVDTANGDTVVAAEVAVDTVAAPAETPAN